MIDRAVENSPVGSAAGGRVFTPPGTGLPRSLLRQLLLTNRLCIGSRVLELTASPGVLQRELDGMGIDVTCLADSPAAQFPLRDGASRAFRCSVPLLELLEDFYFDMVLLRSPRMYGGDLFRPEAFRSTAQLLASLRPGGHLVFLLSPGQDEDIDGHELTCIARHLAFFAGTCCTTVEWARSLADWFRRLVSAADPGHFVLVTHEIPNRPVARLRWLQMAEQAAEACRGASCCVQAAGRAVSGRRAAA